MKIGFTARFMKKEGWKPISEEELNDIFLFFLPRKLMIKPVEKGSRYSSHTFYEVKMETDTLFTLEDIKAKLNDKGIALEGITEISREFSKKELLEVQKRLCFKKVLEDDE